MHHKLDINNVTIARQGKILFSPLTMTLKSSDWLMVRGDNGAGKSSLFAGLMGFLDLASGSALLSKKNLKNNLKKISYISDKYHFNKKNKLFSEMDFLKHLLKTTPNEHIDQIGAVNRLFPAEYYSSGQQRRAYLASVLDYTKPIWLLDEPENSLDSDGLAHLCTLCLEHTKKHHGIVLWASHRPDITGTQEVILG